MRDKIKVLLGIKDATKDELIDLLIDNANEYVASYCNIEVYEIKSRLNSVIANMVLEDFNKLGNEGISTKNFGGVLSQGFINGYSDNIVRVLNKHRKIKTI